MEHYKYNEFMRFMNRMGDGDVRIENSQQPMTSWADDFEAGASEAGATAIQPTDQDADWVRDFAEHKAKQGTNIHISFDLAE